MSDLIKVSIITPYYKGEKTIYNTIDSVFTAYKKVSNKLNLEYIVVIDSMEDKDDIYCKLKTKYGNKITLLKNKQNLGVARTRSNTIKYATGKYILLLDQDDILDENYFKCLHKFFYEENDLILTNGYICDLNKNNKFPIYYVKPQINKKQMIKINKIPTPGLLWFSKKIANEENLFLGYSEQFKGADDWGAYLKILFKYEDLNIKYINNKIFYYNLHDNNYSRNWVEINSSAIATCEYYKKTVDEKDKKRLEKTINILKFENEYKNNKKKHSVKKIIEYKIFFITYINRLIGSIHRRLVK